MDFELETAGGFSARDASEADIRHAMENDSERGEYLILHAPNGGFMQIAGEDDGPFILEHRSSDEEQIQAKGKLSKTQVEEALVSYLRADDLWQTRFEWALLENKSGCLNRAAVLLLLALGVVLAC